MLMYSVTALKLLFILYPVPQNQNEFLYCAFRIISRLSVTVTFPSFSMFWGIRLSNT